MNRPRDKQTAYVLELLIYLMIAVLLSITTKAFIEEQKEKALLEIQLNK